jgi:hypothetical protein
MKRGIIGFPKKGKNVSNILELWTVLKRRSL